MKKILFILVAWGSLLQSSAQEGIITYASEAIAPSENLSESQKELLKGTQREVALMTFSLRYNSSGSFFEEIPHKAHDSLRARIAAIVSGASFPWHQEPAERKSYYNKTVGGTQYLVVFDDKMSDWELSGEAKKIEGFTCYKATITHFNEELQQHYVVEAWYTLEIPIPYGPVGYGGLPGLIIELHYNFTIFTVQEIILNPEGGIEQYPALSRENPVSWEEIQEIWLKQ